MTSSPASSADPGPLSLGTAIVAGLIGGAIAGAATGAIDALWAWAPLSQFLHGFGSKVRLLLFLATCYALAGAAVGALLTSVALFFSRATLLGREVGAAVRRHREARRADPRQAVAGLSLAIAAVPTVAGALAATYVASVHALAMRKHMGLIIAVAMVAALGAALGAALLSFALARPIELLLRRVARRPRLGRALASGWAPLVAVLGLTGVAAIIAVSVTWETVRLLHLRWLAVALVGIALAAPSYRVAVRASKRLETTRAALRRGGIAAGVLLLGLVLLGLGSPEGVRKSADRYSGLGGPITRLLRTLGDFDRDGYSRVLGGGDCDDWNADIHPGAQEIPGDGIDQNCVGGDAKPLSGKVTFYPVPATVPADTNVLLLTIDTVRSDHFSAYGYERKTTPVFDALAADGTLFLNMWAHAPSTRYSMPAILTGRYPLHVYYDYSVHGWPGISQKAITLAEIMQSKGLYTGAILNYWYFDKQRHLDQGFAHYDNEDQKLHRGVPGEGPAHSRGTSSREQTDKAIAFVDKHAKQRFFLWVHYYDPHFEYERHPGTRSFGDNRMDLYDHEILFTDEQIGRLVEDLKQRGLYEKTIIVITGDHGEGFGEHQIDLHGYHLYAAQTRVPLMIRVPGVEPRVITTPVGHIDILPTLANLVGAEPDDQMMGHSLVDLITGAAPPDKDRYVFQELSYENHHEMRAAASQRCHVIYNVSPDTSWELYRIDKDPMEKRDVIDDPGPCAGARKALEAWYDSSQIPAGAGDALLPSRPDIAAPIDVDFGSEVRLLEVRLPKEPVRPGQTFPVTYTFQARAPLKGGWKVFAHFESPSGSRFLGDHEPTRPFAWWRAGQYIRYTKTVHVPRNARPGVYKLWLGLFRGNERRPASSPRVAVRDNRAAVGEVRIGR